MVGWILKKILGSKNQREIKRMMPMVRRINELDEQFKSLSDDELRAKTAAVEGGAGHDRGSCRTLDKLDEILPEAFAVVKNACPPSDRAPGDVQRLRSADDVEHGALRCAAHRRDRSASRPHRGNGDRRRQDAGRDVAALSECAHRPRRAPRDGERLPRPPRRGMDGRSFTVFSA